MKKIQTLLLMFSLFFLCNFSYAATFTFEEGKYQVYVKDYKTDLSSYSADLENISYLEPNCVSPALPDLTIDDSILEELPYVTFIYYKAHRTMTYQIILSDNPLFSRSYQQNSSGYTLGGGYQVSTSADFVTNYINCFTNGTNNWTIGSKATSQNNYFGIGSSSDPVPIYYANYDVINTFNDSIVYSPEFYSDENKIVMENPLTDDEIKSILEIFLESVRNSDLPEHYGRYVLVYNKSLNRYTGFVYPSYINLGMRYVYFDENEEIYHVENAVGPYYYFVEYSHDDDYISQFLDGIDLGMKNPLIYEFRSNSDNSYFRFNTTYNFGLGYEDSFIIDTLNEPIIYTSHKIYSLFFTGTDFLGFGKYEVDEDSSIIKKDFIDPDTGLPTDTTLNEYTDEINSNVNLLSFIKLLFQFVFSLISFIIRFFTFIVNLIIVPASTAILPLEFVFGIDWIHSFTFGDLLLWDIFTILFSVLLSIYIVKLIRSN